MVDSSEKSANTSVETELSLLETEEKCCDRHPLFCALRFVGEFYQSKARTKESCQ